MLQRCVGLNFTTMSTLVTSHPIRSKASPMLPVPLNSSNTLGIFVMHDLIDVPLWVHLLPFDSPRHFRRWLCSRFCFLSILVCYFICWYSAAHFFKCCCQVFILLYVVFFSSNFKQETGSTTAGPHIQVPKCEILVVCVVQPNYARKC